MISSIYLNFLKLPPVFLLGLSLVFVLLVPHEQRKNLHKRRKKARQQTPAVLEQDSNYQRISDYASRIELLHQIDITLAESYDEKSIILMCTVGIQSLLDNSAVAYYIWDRDRKNATKYAQQNDPDYHHDFPQEIPLSHSPSLQNFHQATDISLEESKHPAEQNLLATLKLKTLMALPVYLEHQLIGWVMVGEARHKKPLDEHEMILVNGVITQTRIALERCRILENLQEAEQIKSEMIRMASHDLRTPLAQIGGFIELLRRTLPSLTDEQQLYLSSIERGVVKGKQLLNDILNLDRVESHRPDTWEDLDLLPILESVLQDAETRILLKKHHLTVNLPETLPPVTGSDVQLQQLFMNLIDNAIKYTPEGGLVTVRGWCEERHFVFEVEDTGYGIPEEKQQFLFRRFFRADVPGTETISGTGLGLSLVKAIAQRHHGEVFFTSRLGIGSTFGCKLPFSL